MSAAHAEQLAQRVVRYADLRECKGAFIDTYFEGSEDKVNFQIIGGGVVENPDKFVHITIPHGFNIGGTRKSPGTVNNQHSHQNSEVFLVHRGRYEMKLGPNGEDGSIEVGPGDLIAFPVRMFRGFRAIGDETAHLVSVLGTPTGKVTWAPYVFDKARALSLVLLESGRVTDMRKGEIVPDDDLPVQPTVEEDLREYRRVTTADMETWYLPHDRLEACPESPLAGNGIEECLALGIENAAEGLPAAPIPHRHDFHIRRIRMCAHARAAKHARREVEVVFVHRGRLVVAMEQGEEISLRQGDLFTVPIAAFRTWYNPSDQPNDILVVRGGAHPDSPVFA